MRITVRLLVIVIIISSTSILSGCARKGHTVKVVKPRKHYGWFDGKKDRKKKRTKIVKYKVH